MAESENKMTKADIEKIFDTIRDCLEFHFRNAEDKEDLIDRLNKSLNELENDFKDEAK